jgi:hypothetical protein
MGDASDSRQPAMSPEAELPREPQPLPSQPELQRPPRLQPVNRNQLLWHAVDVKNWWGRITWCAPFGNWWDNWT